MLKNKERFFLILVVLLAVVLRFWQLDKYPVSLNWDEVSHGYNAYSILKTGKDEWGKSFPLIFRAFGDYKLPVYIYLSVLPVAILGLNELAVRFVSAVAGCLAVYGIYLLTNALWKDKTFSIGKTKISLGLVTSFLLAISPWHFFISRPALEANLSLTLIIFGFYFLIKALSDHKYYIYGSILLGLSIHTYNTARVFVPLLIFFYLVRYLKKFKPNKLTLTSLAIFLFFVGIVVYQIITGEAIARYSKLQIITDNTAFQIGQERSKSHLPSVISKLLYNRPVYFVETVAKNYVGYFSPQFWYQSKGAQTQFAIPVKNLFTLPVTILAIVGLIYLLLHFKENNHPFVLAWLFLSPVAASLTADPPQALRPNPMIPAVIMISVVGLYFITSKIKGILKPVVFVVSLLSCSLAFYNYLVTYYGEYARTYADSWQYGYKQAIEYINQNGSKYDHIFITKSYGEPHIFYAFYSKLDPKLLQPGSDNIRFEKSNWFWTDKIGKVYFINDWNIPNTKEAKTLKLESGGEISTKNSLLISTLFRVPSGTKFLESINYPLGYASFIISSIK